MNPAPAHFDLAAGGYSQNPIWRFFGWVWFLGIATAAPLAAQPFQCDGSMYVALPDQSGRSSGLFVIAPGANLDEATFTPVRLDLGIPLHVIGYNVLDNYIYGFNTNNYHFYRIGATGDWTDLGVPTNLDTIQFTYHAGDMGPNGSSFLLVARSKTTGYDARFYSIRFHQSGLSAGYVSVVSTNPVRLEDIAFDPVFGELVGYDSAGNRMVSINTAGAISEGNFSAGIQIESLGSLFFDRNGRLYGYGGRQNVHSTLFQFNRITGRQEGARGGAIGRSSDGCGCPFQIQFTKTIEPQEVLPCSEVTITYRFRNTAGISYGQVRLTDTLPDFFTITSIERPPFFGTVNSGIGASIFDASGMHVLLSEDSVVLRATLDAAPPGRYISQASAGSFPDALGRILYSDDPATTITGDATGLGIAGDGGLFADTLVRRCAGLGFVLEPKITGETILWSNGATSSRLETQTPGTYWVQIEGPCGIYRDTIRLESVPPGLIADLGSERTIIPGETVRLDALLSGNAMPVSYEWSASPQDVLSCSNCPVQQVQPLEETTYFVTVTDEYGCVATDSVKVNLKTDIPVFVPTAFSPDDNGINDIWYPQGASAIAIAGLQVYSRWGELVFSRSEGELNNPAFGWDGSIERLPAPGGVYFWILRLRLADGTEQQLEGTVHLLR